MQPDGANLCSDFLPLACTILSEKLAAVGYEAHFVGKGHLGYETTDHLPISRGFKSHVGYLVSATLVSMPTTAGCAPGAHTASALPLAL